MPDVMGELPERRRGTKEGDFQRDFARPDL